MKDLCEKLRVFERIAAGQHVHVLALGDSSAEHFMVGAHWFDYVNIGFMHKYRKWTADSSSVDNPVLCLNAGISNHTTDELLARFDRDVAPFKPDLVILSAGLNDANPRRGVSTERFRANLRELKMRVNDLDGDVLFQTFYYCDTKKLAEVRLDWLTNLAPYAAIIREAAGELLVDHFTRWERLYKHDVAAFRLLMRDYMHLNPEGNAVIGLDLARALELPIPEENLPWIRGGVFAQKTMDLLEIAEKGNKRISE